jgi:hypothetical protein
MLLLLMVGWHAPNAKTSMNMRYLINPMAVSSAILAEDKGLHLP